MVKYTNWRGQSTLHMYLSICITWQSTGTWTYPAVPARQVPRTEVRSRRYILRSSDASSLAPLEPVTLQLSPK